VNAAPVAPVTSAWAGCLAPVCLVVDVITGNLTSGLPQVVPLVGCLAEYSPGSHTHGFKAIYGLLTHVGLHVKCLLLLSNNKLKSDEPHAAETFLKT
jgi:hypothetical protein